MIRIITKVLIAVTMILSTSIASGCKTSPEITSLPARQFNSEMKGDNKTILDVRTPEEYADGHIDNAVNINVLSPGFTESASKIISKKDTVYVYCRSGKRSLDAARELSRLGYKVVNLKDGIMGWQESGLPVTK